MRNDSKARRSAELPEFTAMAADTFQRSSIRSSRVVTHVPCTEFPEVIPLSITASSAASMHLLRSKKRRPCPWAGMRFNVAASDLVEFPDISCSFPFNDCHFLVIRSSSSCIPPHDAWPVSLAVRLIAVPERQRDVWLPVFGRVASWERGTRAKSKPCPGHQPSRS